MLKHMWMDQLLGGLLLWDPLSLRILGQSWQQKTLPKDNQGQQKKLEKVFYILFHILIFYFNFLEMKLFGKRLNPRF